MVWVQVAALQQAVAQAMLSMRELCPQRTGAWLAQRFLQKYRPQVRLAAADRLLLHPRLQELPLCPSRR